MLSVAVVDDGVNQRLYDTGSLKYDIEITPELNILERNEYNGYLPSHGTICAAIIKKYSPSAVISSIRVLNDKGRALRDQLIAAVYWCVDNGVKLVNLSLGTIDFRDSEAMRKAVNDAYHKGVIIVAACNNKNVYTHPASLSNVIGVKADLEAKLTEGQYRYHYDPLDGIEISACSTHSLVTNDHAPKTTPSCNSFAAPMITAIALNILTQNPRLPLEGLKKELASGGVNGALEWFGANLYPRIDWLESASVFNIHCLKEPIINIPHPFPVKHLIDIECSTKGEGIKKVQGLLEENGAFTGEIDTIVVNTNNLPGPNEEACLFDLSATLDNYNKNLVYLDDDTLSQAGYRRLREKKIKIFHPSIFLQVTGGEKESIEVPVIAVFDFNGLEFLNIISKLKILFQEDGYHAIAVSDTCKGIAAGFEYLPEIKDSMFEQLTLEHINRIYEPDVILIGINALAKNPDYLKNLEDKYEIDLKISITDEKKQCPPSIDSSPKRKIIFDVTCGEENNQVKRMRARELDILQKDDVKIIYANILELFKEDGSLLDKPENHPRGASIHL